MNVTTAIARKLPAFSLFCLLSLSSHATEKRLAYLVSDDRIPYWSIMAAGIRHEARELGYNLAVHSADNLARSELENTVQVLGERVDGIILSPTNSSAAVTILELAEGASIPVVVSDIGADSQNYVSYIESDNEQGGYELGLLLADALERRGWSEGTVGIVGIPQKRANGRARTHGFMRAVEERGLKAAGMFQQSDFSYRETYDFTRRLITENPGLRAIWLQGSNRYKAALKGIANSNKKGEILLVCFDAEPEFIQMIEQGQLVGAGMQQPYLLGEIAVETLHRFLSGQPVKKIRQVPVLPVSLHNLDRLLPIIQRNVLGQGANP